jgi:hypothetical protein
VLAIRPKGRSALSWRAARADNEMITTRGGRDGH